MILFAVVLSQYTRVTDDRQTDRHLTTIIAELCNAFATLHWKTVFVCGCVSFVCVHSHDCISWSFFTKSGTTCSLSVSHHLFPYLALKTRILGWGPENPCKNKKAYICLECLRIANVLASYRKSRSRNTMVASDFRLEVEIWPFRPWSMKNHDVSVAT